MWEEHPEHQKWQARMIGLLSLFCFVVYTLHFISGHDWDSLETSLLVVGGIIIGMGMFVGFVRALVKIFATKSRDKPKVKSNGE